MDSPNDNSLIDIDLASSPVVYPFDPASKLSNTLTIVFSNTQRLIDIPWRDGAAIAIVLYTTDKSDPLAITTVEAAKNIGKNDLRIEGCKRAWSPSFVQGPNSLTLILRPEQSEEPLLGHGEHAQLSVTISNLRSDLPTSVQPIPLLASATGFFGDPLKDAVRSFSVTREACPPPSGNFWPPAIAPFNQPLLAAWDIQFADEMVLTYSDGESRDTTLRLSHGDFLAQEHEFALRKAAFFAGSITLVARNFSNATVFAPSPWPIGISAGSCDIEANICLLNDKSVRSDWSIAPSAIVKKTTATLAPSGGGDPFGPTYEVQAVVEFIRGAVPDALIDVAYTVSGDPMGITGPLTYYVQVSWPGAAPVKFSFTPEPSPDSGPVNLAFTRDSLLESWSDPVTRQGDGPNGPWSLIFQIGTDANSIFSVDLKFSIRAPKTVLAAPNM